MVNKLDKKWVYLAGFPFQVLNLSQSGSRAAHNKYQPNKGVLPYKTRHRYEKQKLKKGFASLSIINVLSLKINA